MNNCNDKISIYTGGLPLYFFSIFILMFFIAFLFSIKSLIFNKFEIILVWGIVLYIWLISYFFFYLLSNKITLHKDCMSVSIVSRKFNRNIWPSVEKKLINFIDIYALYVGKNIYLKEYNKSKPISKEDIINFNDNIILNDQSIICIILNNSINYNIDTKPFTKKSLKKIIKILQMKNIMIIQKYD